MAGPEEVFICPACRRYLPVEEADGKPVCTTDGCEREGEILNRMWMCPACEKCFEGRESVREHGQTAHG